MTRTIVVSNQKGGVAKTTTCLSLGGCLAEEGQIVLLVDMDPQANLTLSLGLKPKTLRRTVGDVLLGNASPVSVSQEGPLYGLDILPANQELSVIDKVLYGRSDFQYRLKNALANLDGFYDYVLIDCPTSVGTLTINGLTAADLLIVPVQCEYYAARTLAHYLDLIKRLRDKTNPSLDYRLLATMYDRRNKICKVVLNKMRRGFRPSLFETIIEVDTKLRESPAFGQPITLYAPDTRGAHQYRALAKELMNHDRA